MPLLAWRYVIPQAVWGYVQWQRLTRLIHRYMQRLKLYYLVWRLLGLIPSFPYCGKGLVNCYSRNFEESGVLLRMNIISNIIYLSLLCNNYSFHNIRRSTNMCAHNVAKSFYELGDYKEWRNPLPPSVCNLDLSLWLYINSSFFD